MPSSTDYSLTAPADVLIVDDMPINLQLLAAYLKAAGHNIRAVPRGDLALNAVASAKPDIILLDVMMPRMSGYEVAEHLQTDPNTADIPIVFISGLSDEGFKKQAFHRGAVDYITKPFKRDDILSTVKKHVEIARHKQRMTQTNTSQTNTSQTNTSQTNAPAANTTSVDATASQQTSSSAATSTLASTSQDATTGLYGRDHFDKLLTQAWQQSLTTTDPLGLILIAIDNSSYVHDSLTAATYTTLLQHTVGLMQENLADDIQICQYEADSLGIVLTGTSLVTALATAEQLCSSISTYDWAQKLSIPVPITASLGVASSEMFASSESSLNPIRSSSNTRHYLLQVAHQQLTQAKAQGGNRVQGISI
jgi:diguanylate cyclase (GGDEF)-like protein